MIHEVTGDILLSGAAAIAHGVAPNDHFNQGLALSLRERWPAMYKDFRHEMHSRHSKEGSIQVWTTEGKQIVHLLTQEHAPGNSAHPGKAKLKYVNHALRELNAWLKKESIASLALPRLATGVGGLEWEDVQPLIAQHLGDAGCSIYLYTEYRKGQKADES